MEYQIDGIPGFESRKVILTSGGIIAGPKLIVDGQVIKNNWGKYMLRRNDGADVQARLQTNLIDPIPYLLLDGKKYFVVAPLKWYELIWAGWPIALLFVGGALGALCGVLAAYTNSRIFRSNFSPAMKYAVTALVSIISVIVYGVSSVLLYMAINR
jgi:hypothetical protein